MNDPVSFYELFTLDRYPQIQPLIDPIAYGDLEQKVENHEKKD